MAKLIEPRDGRRPHGLLAVGRRRRGPQRDGHRYHEEPGQPRRCGQRDQVLSLVRHDARRRCRPAGQPVHRRARAGPGQLGIDHPDHPGLRRRGRLRHHRQGGRRPPDHRSRRGQQHGVHALHRGAGPDGVRGHRSRAGLGRGLRDGHGHYRQPGRAGGGGVDHEVLSLPGRHARRRRCPAREPRRSRARAWRDQRRLRHLDDPRGARRPASTSSWRRPTPTSPTPRATRATTPAPRVRLASAPT